MMKVLEDMKELIEDELKAIRKKGTLTPAELDSIHKAVETLKYIDEICCDEEHSDKGYSGGRYDRYASHHTTHVPAEWNRSYSGGEGSWSANIDGLYSSGRHYGMYSREGARSNMMNKLEDMYHSTDNERDREMIRSWMDKLKWE